MNTSSQYRPFSRAAEPYSIGLSKLEKARFLHVDDQLERYLVEKRQRYETDFDRVFKAENDTHAAQQEVADLIDKTLGNYPIQDIKPATTQLPVDAPLAAAALRVQDDLILMRKDDSGWRLVAASLCFPSSWSLAEKFGHPLDVIHEPVPGMAGKMAARINRIFDSLRPEQPLWRENWTLEGDSNLNHERGLQKRTAAYKRQILQGDIWLRTEYQTLHKLPISKDILFTVKIMTRRLEEIAAHKDGHTILAGLHRQYQEMNEAERSYKGINEGSEKLMTWLKKEGHILDG